MSSPGSTHEILSAKYEPEQELKHRKVVSMSERGVKYCIEGLGDKKSVVYQIDGDIITEGHRCDKLVLIELKTDTEWAEIFVELKGTDVNQALKQIKETVGKLLFKHASNKDIRARIVAKAFPSSKANPEVEIVRRELKKMHGCELKTIKNGQMDKL